MIIHYLQFVVCTASTNESMLGYAAPSSGYGAYSARSGEGVSHLDRYLTNNKQTNKLTTKQTRI